MTAPMPGGPGMPAAPANPAGKIRGRKRPPGGPKGLPPGLGGAPRGQGARTSGGPQRAKVVSALRARFGLTAD